MVGRWVNFTYKAPQSTEVGRQAHFELSKKSIFQIGLFLATKINSDELKRLPKELYDHRIKG